MSRIKRTDSNQASIAQGLRALGLRVFSAHRVGSGFPDLVVLNPSTGRLRLLEVKTPEGRLTPVQERFAASFAGAVDIVYTLAESACAMGVVLDEQP